MRFRPLAILRRFWLALLLLAGVLAVPDASATAWPATGTAELSQHASGLNTRLHHDDQNGRTALDPAWTDADDDTKTFLFKPTSATPAPWRKPRIAAGAAGRITPLSHWPCAGTPTGPPRS